MADALGKGGQTIESKEIDRNGAREREMARGATIAPRSFIFLENEIAIANADGSPSASEYGFAQQIG
jgi:hypothetical protein